MRVKISDLLLWQWKPSIWKNAMSRDFCDEYGPGYTWNDELMVRDLMTAYYRGDNVKPIRIMFYTSDHWLVEYLTPLGLKLFKAGKWCIEDGFHRTYARRRLGYKTIEAEVW